MHRDRRDGIYAYLAAHDSMATRRKLRALGLSDDEIKWAVRDDDLVKLRRGVLGAPGVPFTVARQQRAAVLAAGQGAVLSHFGAAGREGFPQIGGGAIEIAVRRRRAARMVGVTCHIAPDLSDADVLTLDGVPCTSPARTALDLTTRVPPKVLRKIVAHLERTRRPHVFDEIRAAADRISPMRRPQVEQLLALLDRIAPSDGWLDLSPRVLAALSAAGIRSPIAEHPVTWDGHDHVCDYAFVTERVDVEIDDDWSHATAAGSHADKERDRRARRAGWEVVRVTSETDLTELCREVAWLLARRVAA